MLILPMCLITSCVIGDRPECLAHLDCKSGICVDRKCKGNDEQLSNLDSSIDAKISDILTDAFISELDCPEIPKELENDVFNDVIFCDDFNDHSCSYWIAYYGIDQITCIQFCDGLLDLSCVGSHPSTEFGFDNECIEGAEPPNSSYDCETDSTENVYGFICECAHRPE